MPHVNPTPTLANDPKTVKVNVSTGTGMEIEWKDGHRSSYPFVFLRDACPCALCDEERDKVGRQPGEAPQLAPGALPMFKATAKPTGARRGWEIRDTLLVERRARSGHIFMGFSARSLSLCRVHGEQNKNWIAKYLA